VASRYSSRCRRRRHRVRLRGQSGVTERILTRGHRLTTTASCNCSSRSNESRRIRRIATANLFDESNKEVGKKFSKFVKIANQKHPCLIIFRSKLIESRFLILIIMISIIMTKRKKLISSAYKVKKGRVTYRFT